ncbi:MAG: hypothetical protein Ta2B_23770 [Termitinemataceae bacterium]|nr:MAG: hypothetical protein Ta2B_23770 [Termitinemataceae bacterium]
MELQYTYWKDKDGYYVGYFDDFPEHPTQGNSLDELEIMLKDIYRSLELSKYHKRKLIVA